MLLEVYFLGALSLRKVGKLLKTNRCSVEQAISNFVLLFLQLAEFFFCSFFKTSLSLFCQLSQNNVVLCNPPLTQTFILLVQCM